MKFRINEPVAREATVIMQGEAAGHHYEATPQYLTRDGKPYIYRMGEIHYSRVKCCDWERELRKMKDGGIDIIASYVFWNHHEDVCGEFDFSGNRDIRGFVDACERLNLPFFLRIGPWAHGEARYGGFPDWLVESGCELRSEDPDYLKYVRRFFEKLYEQLKTSKNIIGIQVENEKADGFGYMQRLYDMLHEIGFTAPLWSATAWGRADLPTCLLPMFGGYPEAPWAEHVHELDPNPNYFFSPVREDGVIGDDLLGKNIQKTNTEKNLDNYPFLTCELGGGNQNTYQRRPLFSPEDITALAVCKLGSGANGLGYYMYHGGENPVCRDASGKLRVFQESRESGYPNDCPIVSYDFQAPLGDNGQIRDSYYALGEIHRFISAMGGALAQMPVTFPDIMPNAAADIDTPRVSVRSDGESGFLFYNNHVHGRKLCEKRVNVTIYAKSGDIEIPLVLPAGECGIMPFNMLIGSERVRWISAMPVVLSDGVLELCRLNGTEPQVCLSDGTVRRLCELESIGGVKINICDVRTAERPVGRELLCVKKPNVLSFEAFGHIMRRDGTGLCDHTAEYEVAVPDGAETLRVRVMGNVAAAYSMETVPRLISDHFCDGDDWYIDVRNIDIVRLKVQPLTEEDSGTIYFECDMPQGEVAPVAEYLI